MGGYGENDQPRRKSLLLSLLPCRPKMRGCLRGAAANAVVAAWRSFDASGPNSHRQRHVQRGSSRHLPASPRISRGYM